MQYSCGIIFYNNGQILIGHATGQRHWDLPKGKVESGETYKEAAIRECSEETGFIVRKDELYFLGEVPYRKGKRLVLFFYIPNTYPELRDLECTSTYTNKYGMKKPELDKFLYIPVEECPNYLTERMCKSIIRALALFKERISK